MLLAPHKFRFCHIAIAEYKKAKSMSGVASNVITIILSFVKISELFKM
jgi:hypothetical protein